MSDAIQVYCVAHTPVMGDILNIFLILIINLKKICKHDVIVHVMHVGSHCFYLYSR